MANPLLDTISDAGYALDTPGALLRGLLAGQPGSRASGTDLLDAYGLPGGPLGGFAAEMVLDPLSIAGPALGAFRGLRGLSHADDAAPLLRRLGELGGGGGGLDRRLADLAGPADPMDALRAGYRGTVGRPTPAADALGRFAADEDGALRPFLEVGRRTDPDYINSVPWFHGSGTPGLTPATLDPMKTDPHGLFGRGIYTTADPNVAGIGADSYAHARARNARGYWGDDAASVIRRLQRQGDPAVEGLTGDVGSLLAPPGPAGVDPGFLDYLRNLRNASRPERAVAEMFSHAGETPAIGEQLATMAAKRGIVLPAYPRPTLYQAGTDFSNILDLDLPADPKLVGSMRGMVEGLVPAYRAESPDALTTPLDWLDEAARRPDALNSDVLEAAKPSAYADTRSGPDALIKALREAGYDALSHTGGMRAGGGRNLHQVLIGLDPNDTVSGVGRANQMPRFDALDPDAILRLLAGGS